MTASGPFAWRLRCDYFLAFPHVDPGCPGAVSPADNGSAPGEVFELQISQSGPALPAGVAPLNSDEPYFQIIANTSFSGPIMIDHQYDPADLAGPPSGVQMLFWSDAGSNWIDITVDRFPSADVIVGQAPTLSYFTVVQPSVGCCDVAGDADNSGSVNIADVTALIGYIFSGGAAPGCCEEGDADGSGSVNIADATYLIGRIFSGGAAPTCGPAGMGC
ncbi:MAG TPA: dockerin type I domain-containing protein [candidate division Zixibacteria bacterium]|nr:dockerin type I domain-containing protein [candidate division Zixibacteria bacterium]